MRRPVHDCLPRRRPQRLLWLALLLASFLAVTGTALASGARHGYRHIELRCRGNVLLTGLESGLRIGLSCTARARFAGAGGPARHPQLLPG